jgi:hypothetical protein
MYLWIDIKFMRHLIESSRSDISLGTHAGQGNLESPISFNAPTIGEKKVLYIHIEGRE